MVKLSRKCRLGLVKVLAVSTIQDQITAVITAEVDCFKVSTSNLFKGRMNDPRRPGAIDKIPT